MEEIKDQKTIEDYFHHGHFDVIMPDGTREDYDDGISDFYARENNLGECLDSNGSEAFLHRINDGYITVHFFIYERKYEKGPWKEKGFEAVGRLIIDENQEPVYKIEKLEEMEKEVGEEAEEVIEKGD